MQDISQIRHALREQVQLGQVINTKRLTEDALPNVSCRSVLLVTEDAEIFCGQVLELFHFFRTLAEISLYNLVHAYQASCQNSRIHSHDKFQINEQNGEPFGHVGLGDLLRYLQRHLSFNSTNFQVVCIPALSRHIFLCKIQKKINSNRF